MDDALAVAALELLARLSDAEAAEPGGLEGGPGKLSPAVACTSIGERVMGRPLTRDEKAWVRKELERLVMQVEPPSRIRDGLLLGSFYNAIDNASLKQMGVRRVVNMCGEPRMAPPLPLYRAEGIACGHFGIVDQPGQEILEVLGQAVAFLQAGADARALDWTLVHCEYGVSRSASVVLAFLMASEGISLKLAYDSVRAARPKILPNPGFWRALVVYELSLFPRAGASFPSEGCEMEGVLWLAASEGEEESGWQGAAPTSPPAASHSGAPAQ